MMKRFLAGLAMGGFLLGAGLALPDTAHAQMTKSKVNAAVRKGAQATQQKWQSLTPQQQAAAKTQAIQAGQTANQKYQSLTPAQQQQLKQAANQGVTKTKNWYQQLPP